MLSINLTPEQRARLEQLKAVRAGAAGTVDLDLRKRAAGGRSRGNPGDTTITLWLDQEYNEKQTPKPTKNDNLRYPMRGRLVFPFHQVISSRVAAPYDGGAALMLRSKNNHIEHLVLGGKVDFSVFEAKPHSGIVRMSVWLNEGRERWPDPITGEQGVWLNVNIVKDTLEYIKHPGTDNSISPSAREMWVPLSRVFSVSPLRSLPLQALPTSDEVEVYFQKLQRYTPPKKDNNQAGSAASSSSSSSSSSGEDAADAALLAKYDAMTDEEIAELLSTSAGGERDRLSKELEKYEKLKKDAASKQENKNRDQAWMRCFLDKVAGNDTLVGLFQNTLYHRLGTAEGVGRDGMVVTQRAPILASERITAEASKKFLASNQGYPSTDNMTCEIVHELNAMSMGDDARIDYVALNTTLWHNQIHQLCGVGVLETACSLFPRMLPHIQALLSCGLDARNTCKLDTNTTSGAVMINGQRTMGWYASTFGILTMNPFAMLVSGGLEVTPEFAYQLMQQHMADYGEMEDDEEESGIDTSVLMDALDPQSTVKPRFPATRRAMLGYVMRKNPFHAFTEGTITNLMEAKCTLNKGTKRRSKNNMFWVFSNALSDREEQSELVTQARDLYQRYYNATKNKTRKDLLPKVQSMVEQISEMLAPKLLGADRVQGLELALFQVQRRKYEVPSAQCPYDLSELIQPLASVADDDDSEMAKRIRKQAANLQRSSKQIMRDWGLLPAVEATGGDEAVEAFAQTAVHASTTSGTPLMNDDDGASDMNDDLTEASSSSSSAPPAKGKGKSRTGSSKRKRAQE